VGAIDVIAIAAYAAAVLWVGRLATTHARAASARQDWALAGRALPTPAVLASMVATEVSAATFIGVPHAAYTGDWSYLQLAFGALAGKLVLAVRVIPLYHARGVVTVYEFLDERFGPSTRRSAAACFAIGRSFASGARLFIAAFAFSAATGVPVSASILGCALVAGLYTRSGGLRAVVWTDCLQAAVLVAGGSAALALASVALDGGVGAFAEWLAREQRARVFHLERWITWSSISPMPLGNALVAGFFLTLATHATDHDMVQRLLAARSGRAGGRALWLSALVNFPMTLLFLSLGSAIAYAYSVSPPAYDISDAREALPLFAAHALPAGVRGLVFAGLFAAAMSSLDSAVCAIATTWLRDVRPPVRSGDDPPLEAIRRVSTWSCTALAVAALAMAGYQELLRRGNAPLPSMVEFALSAMTILYGALLGVFAVAVLRPGRSRDRAGCAALAVGAAAGLALFLQPLLGATTGPAWGYWIPLSATLAAGVALLPLGRTARHPGAGAPPAKR